MDYVSILRSSKIDANNKVPPFPIDVVWLWCGRPEAPHCPYTEDLKYSMRSVLKNIPWVRNLVLVVQDDFLPPFWMNTKCKKLRIVRLASVLPPNTQPNNNYNVLTSYIYRIKGLSEHFIFLHDDMYICRPTPWTCFFTERKKNGCVGINRHYPGKDDHAINCPDHRIPYVRMWVNAIIKYNIHNTRIQQQAQPFRKSLLAKYYVKYTKEIEKAAKFRWVSGQYDFPLMRFYIALSSSTNGKEAVMVKTDEYDWRIASRNAQVIDYFVEGDDVQGVKNILRVMPRFLIVNNSNNMYSHLYSVLKKMFPESCDVELQF